MMRFNVIFWLVLILVIELIWFISTAYGDVPRVVDGDTLAFKSHKVRIIGIDAPERGQTCKKTDLSTYKCGKVATDALKEFIAGQDVVCAISGKADRYSRTLSKCWVGGKDIAAFMVENGHAEAYRKYSLEYVAQEEAAKASGLGMWSGPHVSPTDWRKGIRE